MIFLNSAGAHGRITESCSDTPLDRTPTSEDIEDVVDAWNFSPGDLLPVVTKEVLDKTVWVLHGFQSSPTEFFNLLGPGFRKKRQRVNGREAYRRICQFSNAWNLKDTALVLAFLRLHADDATLDRQGRRMIELWLSSHDSWRFRMIRWIQSELSRPRKRSLPLGWRKAALHWVSILRGRVTI